MIQFSHEHVLLGVAERIPMDLPGKYSEYKIAEARVEPVGGQGDDFRLIADLESPARWVLPTPENTRPKFKDSVLYSRPFKSKVYLDAMNEVSGLMEKFKSSLTQWSPQDSSYIKVKHEISAKKNNIIINWTFLREQTRVANNPFVSQSKVLNENYYSEESDTNEGLSSAETQEEKSSSS